MAPLMKSYNRCPWTFAASNVLEREGDEEEKGEGSKKKKERAGKGRWT